MPTPNATASSTAVLSACEAVAHARRPGCLVGLSDAALLRIADGKANATELELHLAERLRYALERVECMQA